MSTVDSRYHFNEIQVGSKSTDLEKKKIEKKECNMFDRDNAEYNRETKQRRGFHTDPSYPDPDASHGALFESSKSALQQEQKIDIFKFRVRQTSMSMPVRSPLPPRQANSNSAPKKSVPDTKHYNDNMQNFFC